VRGAIIEGTVRSGFGPRQKEHRWRATRVPERRD